MPQRNLVILLALSLGIGFEVSFGRVPARTNAQQVSVATGQSAQQFTTWVGESLKQMQSVKAGMTRAELLKVFTTEGGLSSGLRRTYPFRECPYFKVDVEFDAVGRPAQDRDGRITLIESDADVIKKISKP